MVRRIHLPLDAVPRVTRWVPRRTVQRTCPKVRISGMKTILSHLAQWRGSR